MSVSVFFHGAEDGDDGPFELSSAVGWNLLGEWAAHSKPLRDLAATGCHKGTDEISHDLAELLDKSKPDNPNVESTAKRLLELIGVGDENETMEVEL